MNYKRLYGWLCPMTAVLLLLCMSCVKEDALDLREKGYGYVQFKLYKAASYPGTKAPGDYDNDKQIDSLSLVSKLEVKLEYNGSELSQTLVMNAYDDNNAEYGLRSDKLKLLTGQYTILSYSLYDKLDNKIVVHNPSGWIRNFEVVSGGLLVHDLLATVEARGNVKFRVVKAKDSFLDRPDAEVKSTGGGQNREYSLDEIKTISLKLVSSDNEPYTFEKLPVKFSVHFDEDDEYSDSFGYQTSSLTCDSLLVLPAGEYTIEEYTAYDSNKSPIEVNRNVNADNFEVKDNQVTDVDVPVKLFEVNEYIKDYYALYEIWKSLEGEKWFYSGEDFAPGANWDFNKDPDLWGDQPGVSLHSNGRVALINISDFGFGGTLPEAISQLTELTELYLGTHNDMNQNEFKDPTLEPGTRDRMARHKKYLAYKYPAIQFSEPVARGMMENGVEIPEIAQYKTMSETAVLKAEKDMMNRIQLKDVTAGKLYNSMKEIHEAIWTLDKLERLTIANGLLEDFPAKPSEMDSEHGLMSLTDLEIYNCRELNDPTEAIKDMPSLVSLNLSQNNPNWTSEQANNILHSLAAEDSKSCAKIQILYMNNSRLTRVDGGILRKMKSLGLLDLSDNEIAEVTAFGDSINFVQLHLNNNKIKKLEKGQDEAFCKMVDVETFSVRNNLITEFPDIFDASSKYGMTSVDFSYNQISSFAGYERDESGKEVLTGTNGGIYVETLTLANNPIKTYPMMFRDTDSKVAYVNLRGCGMTEIPDSAFSYDNAVYLTSFDLSYNKLKKFPMNFHAGNVPYLYGLDVSYNCFSEFPYEQFDMRGLTVFAIRGQRDENGEKCLREWPTGVYQHAGLRGLYLGSNDIGKVEDTISPLCYYLDISDNDNIVFDASDICYEWQRGAYILFYDKWQDIRGCDLMLN